MGRRWVKVLAITVVVLALLFTVADRVAVHYADNEATHLAAEKYGYQNTTDGHLEVSVEGFPFLSQALSQNFDHVKLTADQFTIDTTNNALGGYLPVQHLQLDLHGVQVTSLTARSAEANLATGTLTLSYDALSGVVTRLAGNGGPIHVSQAPGSTGQAARLKVTGTVGGQELNGTGTLLAQGTEISLNLPGADQPTATWRVELPENVGFTEARATADGVRLSLVGHLVNLGSSRFTR
ncbi:LmeA family phospholipid-binding protein [Streptomyces sp. NPDC002516]